MSGEVVASETFKEFSHLNPFHYFAGTFVDTLSLHIIDI